MPEFNIEVEFEVYCGTCGRGLCNQSSTSSGRTVSRVDVEVCRHCLEEAKDEAYRNGYEDGRDSVICE